MLSRAALALLLGLSVVAAGCGGSSRAKPQSADLASAAPVPPIGPTTPPPSEVTRFTDIPVPPDNTMDLERTVMVGGQADWLGRVLLSTPMPTDAVWEFYRREMPRYGWHEIAAHWRPPHSVLFYQLKNRVATIELGSRGGMTQIEFWMNPRNSPSAPDSQGSLARPQLADGRMQGATGDAVASGPLDKTGTAVPEPPHAPGPAVEEAQLPPPPWQ